MAAPLSADIPLTQRGCADQVLIVTGRAKDGAFPDLPLFSPSRTLVFLMAKAKSQSLCEELVMKGYSEDEPVGIIENGTLPNERVFRCPLLQLASTMTENDIKEPVVLVIGKVVTAISEGGEEAAAPSNMLPDPTIQEALLLINACHSEDPVKDSESGLPMEMVYCERIEKFVSTLMNGKMSDALMLASRSQHLERWKVPRNSFPEGRNG